MSKQFLCSSIATSWKNNVVNDVQEKKYGSAGRLYSTKDAQFYLQQQSVKCLFCVANNSGNSAYQKRMVTLRGIIFKVTLLYESQRHVTSSKQFSIEHLKIVIKRCI